MSGSKQIQHFCGMFTHNKLFGVIQGNLALPCSHGESEKYDKSFK
jgi:hypothetical protein